MSELLLEDCCDLGCVSARCIESFVLNSFTHTSFHLYRIPTLRLTRSQPPIQRSQTKRSRLSQPLTFTSSPDFDLPTPSPSSSFTFEQSRRKVWTVSLRATPQPQRSHNKFSVCVVRRRCQPGPLFRLLLEVNR